MNDSRAASDSAVDRVAEQYMDNACALDPLVATYVGITGYDDRLPDLSPDGFAEREQAARRAISQMEAAAAVDAHDQTAKETFLERLGVTVDQYDVRVPQSQVSVIASAVHEIRGAFDLMGTSTEDDWHVLGSRLAAVPAALDGYQRTLLENAEQGHVSAKRQLGAVAGQLRAWTGEGHDASFFADLVAPARDADLSSSVQTELALRAGVANAAFAGFAQFIERDLLPRGRDRDGVGREQYAPQLRSFLGASVDLDETYAWGWAELYRIEQEAGRVADKVVPGGTLADAVAALDRDPARRIHGTDNFRAWMQDLADRTIADMTDTHFDIPEPIRAIECRIAPTNDGGIYYTGPSEDWSRPGRMWWAVPDGIEDFSTWREVTTVYHEGVPGHHLQVAQTAYRRDVLNRWQRMMCWVSGHGEGWALYAERLMDDLGYLDDPGDKLGMLDGQALRAVRVIVDIGMHLELTIPADNPFGFHPGEVWTPDLGLEFMREHVGFEDAVVQFEHSRYLGWPGQAPSYKVGERIWLQARDEARARRGADFDLKLFHRQALDLGSLGLDQLRAALSRL